MARCSNCGKAWRSIPEIDDAIDKAVNTGTTGTRAQAIALLYAAQAVVLDCDDLSPADQERVVNEVWDHYNKHVPTDKIAQRGSSLEDLPDIPEPGADASNGNGTLGGAVETVGTGRQRRGTVEMVL